MIARTSKLQFFSYVTPQPLSYHYIYMYGVTISTKVRQNFLRTQSWLFQVLILTEKENV